jgi:hypothetical protein
MASLLGGLGALGGLAALAFARRPPVVEEPPSLTATLASTATSAHGTSPPPLPAEIEVPNRADATSEPEARAQHIIADARAAYAACDTYEDEGTHDTAFRGDGGRHRRGAV